MSATLHAENPRTERFMSLVGDLQTDIKNLIKKEFELAKAEMGEKAKVLGRNAGFAAAGGVIGLMAVFLLLLGIGAIFAQLLVKAGLSPGVAYFVAYIGFGIILAIVGYLLIQKAVTAFSKVSLAPDKTLETVRGYEVVPLHSVDHHTRSESKPSKPTPSSDELQGEVITTRNRMESEMLELKSRLTPAYMGKSLAAGLKHHPVTALLFGAGTSLGGYLYWRKRHQVAVVKSVARAARRGFFFRVRRA